MAAEEAELQLAPGAITMSHCWRATGVSVAGGALIAYPRARSRGLPLKPALLRCLRYGAAFGMFTSLVTTTALILQTRRGNKVDLWNTVAGGTGAGAAFGFYRGGPGPVQGLAMGAGLGLLYGGWLMASDMALAAVARERASQEPDSSQASQASESSPESSSESSSLSAQAFESSAQSSSESSSQSSAESSSQSS